MVKGDISPNSGVGRTAAFYMTVAHGLALRFGDDTSHAQLIGVVDNATAAWAVLVEPQRMSDEKQRKRILNAQRKASKR